MRLFPIVLLSTIMVSNVFAQSPSRRDAAEIEKAVMTVLDDFMTNFNAMDMSAWEQTMHFPHYLLAGVEMRVQNRPGELRVEVLRRAIGEEWHHSAWDKREIVHLSESKVHVDTKFVRHREDGSVIVTGDALYILTKENGRWGVKMRSPSGG